MHAYSTYSQSFLFFLNIGISMYHDSSLVRSIHLSAMCNKWQYRYILYNYYHNHVGEYIQRCNKITCTKLFPLPHLNFQRLNSSSVPVIYLSAGKPWSICMKYLTQFTIWLYLQWAICQYARFHTFTCNAWILCCKYISNLSNLTTCKMYTNYCNFAMSKSMFLHSPVLHYSTLLVNRNVRIRWGIITPMQITGEFATFQLLDPLAEDNLLDLQIIYLW